ncbi:MAG: bifunctional phosphoglucose/phosphomannose isomerase [Candidatus Lokiarchaeota archaeon]|nr:bifunctional phosphoglucose/phosphomannose isomerase [Candidatus Lokiarchaeota archaeon]
MTDASVLDDPGVMASLDPQGMLGIVEGAPDFMKWCLDEFELDKGKNIERSVQKRLPKRMAGIAISGMGGSAISGDVVLDWIADASRVPVIVNREYRLPACVDGSWLGFFLSYSGNTEETLSAYLDAKRRGINCICVTSGGMLEEAASKAGDLRLKVPGGLQPRAAMLYLFTALAIAVADCKLLDKKAMVADLLESHEVLGAMSKALGRSVPLKDNPAKQHAAAVHGTAVLVYGFDFYRSAARRFKGQLNENGKNPAYYDTFPELNHNETVGWEVEPGLARHFSCIFIRDPAQESPALNVRIGFTRRLVSEKAKTAIDIVPSGRSRLARMLSVMYAADFVSVYLAFLNGTDPTPVRYIQGLKDELGKKANMQAEIAAGIAKLGRGRGE